MNYLQPNTYGLDAIITQLQTMWYGKALSIWNPEDEYNLFGRSNRNKAVGQGYYPEVYYNGGNTTPEGTQNNGGMFFSDSVSGFSFFDEISTKYHQGRDVRSVIRMVTSLRLDQITPAGIANAYPQSRLDDIAMWDLVNWFNVTKASNFNVISNEKSIDKVYDRYSGPFKQDALTKNVGNRFSFSVDFELIWNPLLYQNIKN